MSWKNHTMIAAGVVDRDYEGEMGIAVFNHGGNELKISPGGRVAQFILERCETPPVHDVRKNVSGRSNLCIKRNGRTSRGVTFQRSISRSRWFTITYSRKSRN